MAEQRLDDADIDTVLEQVGGEAVAERMRSDALVDIGGLRGFDDDAVELPRADRRCGTLSGEEPAVGNEDALLPSGAPPVAQQQEQALRQHGVAVPPAFTALDPEQHALAIDVADLAQAEKDPTAEFAREEIDRFVLRRTKDQCLDLPAKSFADVQVELPPWQRQLYNEMRDEMVCRIQAMSGEEFRAFATTALAQLTRLSQIASNPALIFPEADGVPAKFDLIDNLLADVLSVPDRKIIIWSNYVRSIETLLDRLAEFNPIAMYGGTPEHKRQDLAKQFQEDPATRVLIANPAAAGTGFTFTAASYTIYESLSWRYDHYAQSQDRNHRIGQTAPVTYMRLIATDTIDEAIVAALERKSGLARALLGDAGASALVTDLSKEEMCALIAQNKLPGGA